MSKSEIIKYDPSVLVRQLTSSVIISDKLVFDQKVKLIEEIFQSNPKILINYISQYYPLDEEMLDSFGEYWNWGFIRSNSQISWNPRLIGKFASKWDWSWQYVGWEWDDQIIDLYKDRIDWESVSGGSKFFQKEWSEQILEKYKSVLKWETLSGNHFLPWSISFVERFIDLLDWDVLSSYRSVFFESRSIAYNETYDDTEKILEKFIHKWNWNVLSGNHQLNWNDSILNKFMTYWNWEKIGDFVIVYWSDDLYNKFKFCFNQEKIISIDERRNEEKIYEIIYENEIRHIHWYTLCSGYDDINNSILTEDFIQEYEGKIHWVLLSENNKVNWTKNLIRKYQDKIDWYSLSNLNYCWGIDIIEKFQEYWNWDNLSRNTQIEWTNEIILKFKDKWNWSKLSENNSLPWTEEFVERYVDDWSWYGLSKNYEIPTSSDFIEKYSGKWNWNYLCRNPNIKWSKDLLNKFKEKLSWKDIPTRNWPLDLIRDFENNLNWDSISKMKSVMTSIWAVHEFKDYLNADEMDLKHLSHELQKHLTNQLICEALHKLSLNS